MSRKSRIFPCRHSCLIFFFLELLKFFFFELCFRFLSALATFLPSQKAGVWQSIDRWRQCIRLLAGSSCISLSLSWSCVFVSEIQHGLSSHLLSPGCCPIVTSRYPPSYPLRWKRKDERYPTLIKVWFEYWAMYTWKKRGVWLFGIIFKKWAALIAFCIFETVLFFISLHENIFLIKQQRFDRVCVCASNLHRRMTIICPPPSTRRFLARDASGQQGSCGWDSSTKPHYIATTKSFNFSMNITNDLGSMVQNLGLVDNYAIGE